MPESSVTEETLLINSISLTTQTAKPGYIEKECANMMEGGSIF